MEFEMDYQIIEGIKCYKKSTYSTGINPGNLYLAKRNQGWKLLTCRSFDSENNIVFPEEVAYAYDSRECFKCIEGE